MSDELKLLFYLLLFGLPLLANLLEKVRKKQLERRIKEGHGVHGQTTRKVPAPRGSTGQRPSLAEWIEELRRQSGEGGDLAPAPKGRPLLEEVAPEEVIVEHANPMPETRTPAPPPLGVPEDESKTQAEEFPLTEAAQLLESEDLADATILSSTETALVSPSSRKRGLVMDRRQIQRAIVMREILGPPRALEIMGRKEWSEMM